MLYKYIVKQHSNLKETNAYSSSSYGIIFFCFNAIIFYNQLHFNCQYAMIIPVTFLIPGLMHRKEDKRLKYQTIYSGP